MTREPVKCVGCGTYLSGKNRESKEQKCNNCTGVGYNPKPMPKSHRKILWKKKH